MKTYKNKHFDQFIEEKLSNLILSEFFKSFMMDVTKLKPCIASETRQEVSAVARLPCENLNEDLKCKEDGVSLNENRNTEPL